MVLLVHEPDLLVGSCWSNFSLNIRVSVVPAVREWTAGRNLVLEASSPEDARTQIDQLTMKMVLDWSELQRRIAGFAQVSLPSAHPVIHVKAVDVSGTDMFAYEIVGAPASPLPEQGAGDEIGE
ncbi:MAG: hypothetical protein H0X45_03815 [Planctomycetes bacterium]|nr:hypothetical protein [Planctomycetota bacterium]